MPSSPIKKQPVAYTFDTHIKDKSHFNCCCNVLDIWAKDILKFFLLLLVFCLFVFTNALITALQS